jgi:hypothetical protein
MFRRNGSDGAAHVQKEWFRWSSSFSEGMVQMEQLMFSEGMVQMEQLMFRRNGSDGAAHVQEEWFRWSSSCSEGMVPVKMDCSNKRAHP